MSCVACAASEAPVVDAVPLPALRGAATLLTLEVILFTDSVRDGQSSICARRSPAAENPAGTPAGLMHGLTAMRNRRPRPAPTSSRAMWRQANADAMPHAMGALISCPPRLVEGSRP